MSTASPVTINHPPETEALAKILKDTFRPEFVEVTTPDGRKAPVLVAPKGFDIHGVKPLADAFLTAPERRKGTAVLLDAASFIAHVDRFKDADSAIFADPTVTAPKLVAVLDYHRAGGEGAPRFGGHRACYAFPLSDEWKTWTGKHGVRLTQGDFAEFLEDHVVDVLGPDAYDYDHPLIKHGGSFASPSKLVELSQGLQVNVGAVVKNAKSLSSGEISLQYVEEHTDGTGRPLKVPTAFLIAIPVFRGGAPYRIGVRLRYRVKGPSVEWFLELHRTDKVFEHAFDEVCADVEKKTALPLYRGTPEQ